MTADHRNFAHLDRRDDVDGLRAVAVLSVLAFHAAPGALQGGFAGVDVFFVISGFIISSILFKNLDRGTFSFAEFYARRIRRIFPALVLVMLCCLAAGWVFLFADEYAQLGKHVAAGASFVSNIALWAESGYFDNSGETKPLLHLWSLGIEEQFYIFWPFVAWLAWKLRFNLAVVAAAIVAVSFSLNLTGANHDPVATFYSPQTRFWELLLGTLLSWMALYRPHVVTGRGIAVSNGFAIAGAMLLACSFVFLRSEGFPGLWAVGPVAGAFLLIAAGPKAWINRVLLSNRIFVWFGAISFPLYLWHWPLLSFGRIIQGDTPSALIRLGAVGLSIVLAWLTVQLIERHMRAPDHGRLKVAFLCAVMTMTGIAGYLVYREAGMPSRAMAQIGEQVTQAKRDWKYETTRFEDGKIVGIHYLAGQEPKSVLFIGSSLMGQYYPRANLLYSEQPKPTLSTIYASRNHCTPIPQYDLISGPENINCQDYYAAAMELARDQSVLKVVLAGDWPRFFFDGKLTEQGELFVSDLRSLIDAGKQVYLIGRPPMDRRFEPSNVNRSLGSALGDWSMGRQEAEDEESISDTGRLADLVGAVLINPLDYLCTTGVCPVIRDGKPLYNDASHIRADYAAASATFIDELVER